MLQSLAGIFLAVMFIVNSFTIRDLQKQLADAKVEKTQIKEYEPFHEDHILLVDTSGEDLGVSIIDESYSAIDINNYLTLSIEEAKTLQRYLGHVIKTYEEINNYE